MTRSAALAGFGVMLIACGGPALPDETKAVRPQPQVPESPTGPAPLRIDVAGLQPAAWLEPPLDTPIMAPLTPWFETAVGTRSAVISTPAGHFVAHLDDGVSGPIAPPAGFTWLGIGGDEEVLAATPDGALWAAGPSGFAARGTVKGATAWAASHHLIVATVGERVHVSRDGAKFRSYRVAKGFAATDVFARPDGVVVVIGAMPGEVHAVTFVSKTGATWKRSKFQPAAIVQHGAIVRSADDDCVQAVMASGTLGWVSYEAAPWPPASLARMLVFGDHPALPPIDGYATSLTLVPPAFDAARAVTGVSERCDIRNGDIVGKPGKVSTSGSVLYRVAGLPGAAAAPTATALALLSDGANPTPLAFDRATGAAHAQEPPAGCTAEGAYAVRGLAVLVCTDGAVFAFVDGAWRHEGALAGPPTSRGLAVADDGTASLYTCTGTTCTVAIRDPRAPGDGAWRALALAEAAVIRVLPGGDAIALVPDPTSRPRAVRVSVVRVPRDGAPEVLASGIEITEVVTGFELVDGTAQLSFESGTRTVYNDGTVK